MRRWPFAKDAVSRHGESVADGNPLAMSGVRHTQQQLAHSTGSPRARSARTCDSSGQTWLADVVGRRGGLVFRSPPLSSPLMVAL